MRRIFFLSVVFSVLYGIALAGDQSAGQTGEQLFNQHCAACHPKGGNIINPDRTLYKNSMASHDINTSGDIISYMRNPGLGMPAFDKQRLSDKLARQIAEYILREF
jgi:cytochrome c6